MSFKPVTLVSKDGKIRKATTANEETQLRFNGWKTAPEGAAPKPSAPKSDSK